MKLTRFKKFLSEAKNTTDLAIFSGRFQGFNIGHQTAIKSLQNKYERTVVFVVEGSKTDKEKNPFSGELRKEMIETACPNVDVYIIPNGFIPGAIKYLKLWKGKEKVVIAAGADREDGYKAQKSETKTPYEIEYIQTERPEGVSGTMVRKALKEDDFEAYKKVCAKGLDTTEWFMRLKNEIN